LIYAGIISNTLESAGPVYNTDPEKSQRQGINQQELNKLIFNQAGDKEFLQ